MKNVKVPLILMAALLGCSQNSPDRSAVLVNVGGEKITRDDLARVVKLLSPDPTQTKAFLEGEQARRERGDFVRQLAFQKAIIAYARKQGLDKDPAVQVSLEKAMAQAYFNTMVQRRERATPPSDAELTTMYEEIRTKTPAIPPFEQVKEQLRQSYGQWQFNKELRLAIPMTFSDEVGEPGS